MKKFTTTILGLLLMLGATICGASIISTAFPLHTSAAGAATLTASSVECKQGDTIKITATLSNNPGIAGLVITPQSSTSDITFSGASNGSVLGNMTSGSNLVFDASSDSKTNGTLCTVTFKVSTSLAPGTYKVYFTVRGCSNASGEDVSVNTVKGTVKVSCKSHSYGSWSTISNATCTSSGKQKRTCSVCGASETQSTNTLGHNWSSYKETKAPTCTSSGTKTRTCSRCNQSESKSVDATGHSYDKLEITKEPTCTEKGVKSGVCKKCGETITKSVEATGHDFGDWEEVTAATFSEAGTEKRTCTKCNTEETRAIEALGYEFTEPSSSKESVFAYYDITTTVSQENLDKKGYVNAKFAIPSGADYDAKLYYITENGALEQIEASVSENGDFIEAKLTKLGTYAVCKILSGDVDVTPEEEPSDTDSSIDNNTNNPTVDITDSDESDFRWIWIVIAGVEAIVILGYVAFVFWKRKKKSI